MQNLWRKNKRANVLVASPTLLPEIMPREALARILHLWDKISASNINSSLMQTITYPPPPPPPPGPRPLYEIKTLAHLIWWTLSTVSSNSTSTFNSPRFCCLPVSKHNWDHWATAPTVLKGEPRQGSSVGRIDKNGIKNIHTQQCFTWFLIQFGQKADVCHENTTVSPAAPLTSGRRLKCAAKVPNTPWANLFCFLTSTEQTNTAVPWGTQTWSNRILFLYKYRTEVCQWRYWQNK